MDINHDQRQVKSDDTTPFVAAKTDFLSNMILNGYQSKRKITDLLTS